MTNSTTLIELLLSILRDPSALDAYRDDPDGFLASCGDISPEDVREALVLLEDNQDASFDRDYNTGGNQIHVPPPPPAPEPEPGESDHEAAVKYLNTYITNNHIDDRDTITDNSVNQQIDTGGGDFDQDIDIDSTVASGDGSVAAGDDIEDSEIVTGDDNVVGDDNVKGDGNITGDDNDAVIGDDNTTSFGDGDATSAEIDGDVNVDDGGSLAVGGGSTVDNTDNSVEDSFNDNSDNSTEDSFNDNSETTDNSDYSVEDSFNDNSETTEDSNNETEESLHTQVM
ncbi:IniB N-terminal domain-containing protein [Pseudonocardia sichuanensis]